jgi:nucleotide-binding universal stress UspA family protein
VVVRPVAGPRETEPERIVVATSGTESSTAAMEFAFAHAALLDVPLTVVHCFDFRHGLAGLTDLDLEGLLVGRRAIAESVAGMREKYPDVDVDFELGRGPAVPYLAHASEEAAMIVVGAARRAGADADAVDPVTRGVVEHAHSTVAVVPTAT